MKIVHVIRSDGFAGVERHVATLAIAQAELGDTVTVIGGDQVAMRTALAGTGVRTLSGDTVASVLRRVSQCTGAAIVHAHMTAGELAAAVAVRRVPIVATRHFARRRGATPIGRLAAKLIRRRVRAQIAISEYVATTVDRSATVIYPGVPIQESTTTPREPVVLVVQRLQPEKETHVALRAFAAGAPPDWSMQVVGRGPEQATLQALTEELRIKDRVTFLGFRPDVPKLMRTSAVLIAPCRVEGLGLSVLEAMSHGLPVIASRAGAHKETVGQALDARMFPAGDWRNAAEQLRELSADAKRRHVYGETLRAVQQQHFTPQAQADATAQFYAEVLTHD